MKLVGAKDGWSVEWVDCGCRWWTAGSLGLWALPAVMHDVALVRAWGMPNGRARWAVDGFLCVVVGGSGLCVVSRVFSPEMILYHVKKLSLGHMMGPIRGGLSMWDICPWAVCPWDVCLWDICLCQSMVDCE